MYNKTGGARPLGLLFEEKARRCAKKIERVTAPLGGGWDEGDQAPMDGLESESYSSSAFGPSSACVQPPTSMAKFNLVWLLLLFLPLQFWQRVADWTIYYATEQDVVKRGTCWLPVGRGSPQWASRRKRYQRKRKWIKMTPWYLLVWLGVMIRNGARRKRSIYESWCSAYDLRDSAIADTINRDAFAQAQQFVVFQDYSSPRTSAAGKSDKC